MPPVSWPGYLDWRLRAVAPVRPPHPEGSQHVFVDQAALNSHNKIPASKKRYDVATSESLPRFVPSGPGRLAHPHGQCDRRKDPRPIFLIHPVEALVCTCSKASPPALRSRIRTHVRTGSEKQHSGGFSLTCQPTGSERRVPGGSGQAQGGGEGEEDGELETQAQVWHPGPAMAGQAMQQKVPTLCLE